MNLTPEAEIAQIKIALEQVAVYEGLVEVSPVALLVSELVRDHEELEARIDAAFLVLREALTGETGERGWAAEVSRLLSGGTRVPDDLSGLSDLS